MYAIIRSGGKQYRVTERSVVRLERLGAGVGAQVELGEVALIGGEAGVQIGVPTVAGARVLGRVVAEGRTRRIVVYKYKPKKGYHRRRGHRQAFDDVLIQQILGPGEQPREQSKGESAGVAGEPVVESAPIDAAATVPAVEDSAVPAEA